MCLSRENPPSKLYLRPVMGVERPPLRSLSWELWPLSLGLFDPYMRRYVPLLNSLVTLDPPVCPIPPGNSKVIVLAPWQRLDLSSDQFTLVICWAKRPRKLTAGTQEWRFGRWISIFKQVYFRLNVNFPGCQGLYYPVFWGLFHKPWQGSLVTHQ